MAFGKKQQKIERLEAELEDWQLQYASVVAEFENTVDELESKVSFGQSLVQAIVPVIEAEIERIEEKSG